MAMIRHHETPLAWRAGAFALLVHLVLLAVLLLSVNWKSKPPMSIAEVELWDTLPQPVKPQPVAPPPKPEPPKPEPKPEPQPEPKPDPTPEPKAEIQMKQEKPKKVEPPKDKPQDKPKQEPDPAKQKELDKKKQDALKKLQQELLAEDAQPQSSPAPKSATPQMSQASLGEIDKYKAMIMSKIRRNVNTQVCGSGKPELEVEINLMPTGDVIGNPRLLKGSGIAACDEAVERAILQSQPLPLPPQSDLFSQFRDLRLKFRPNDVN